MRIDRRDLLATLGGLGMMNIASAPAFAARLRDYPFTLGVASGDPWPDGFVLWTRLAPRPLDPGSGMPQAVFTVAWEVSTDPVFATIVRRGEANALPELGHSIHVELGGLEPARAYWYRFRIDGHASPAGRVRTAPTAGSSVDRLRIGGAGCQNYAHGYFTAYRYMAQEGLDAIFHYGDYIYEGEAGKTYDVPVVRDHIGREPLTLDDYRLRYGQYKLDPDLQSAHASTAFLMTFDDHEVDDNWAGSLDKDGTDPALFLRRRCAALQAWYENLPVRAAQRPTARGVSIYRRLDYGRLLRLHLLDTRQFRDDQICGTPEARHCRDPRTLETGTLLGEAQHRWLADGLDKGFGWNLIAQQVMVMPHDRFGDHLTDTPQPDSWLGYPASRRRLVKSIRDKQVDNVVIATGDVHQNIVGYIPERDDAPDRDQVACEFVCTSISTLGDGRDVKIRKPDFRPIIARNPNLLFANGHRGYHVFTITDRQWRTDMMKVDTVSDHNGQLSRLASFVIDSGSPLAAQA